MYALTSPLNVPPVTVNLSLIVPFKALKLFSEALVIVPPLTLTLPLDATA